MTCKNCYHYNVCLVHCSERVLENRGICDHFQDRELIQILPCKVGDTVWFNTYKQGNCVGIESHKVDEVLVKVHLERGYAEPYTEIGAWQFGKTVFLTEEEAKAVLEE